MSRFSIILIVSLLISGCENGLFEFIDMLQGVQTEQVIISDEPSTIEKMIDVEPSVPVKVVGESSSLCLSLLGGVEHIDSDKEFSSLIDDVQIKVIATAIGGLKTEFSRESRSWSVYGAVEPNKEISLCLLESCPCPCPCEDKRPIGTEYKRFEITSSKKLDIKGIYWHSTNRWDEKN